MTTVGVAIPAAAQGGGGDSGERVSAASVDADDIDSEEPVPVMDNFTVGELVLTGSFAVTAAVIGYWGEHIVGFPDESMKPPEPGSLDWEASYELRPDADLEKPFLGGVPDVMADPFSIVGAGVYYGFGAAGTWFTDADWIPDTRHEFLAYAGAATWTQIFVQGLKFSFGRKRPYVVRRCNPPEDPCGKYGIPPERNVDPNRQDILAFPGGHTASTAATLSFVYLDLSDYLVYDALADSSDSTRFWVGRVLPFIPTYGLIALSFYDRLYEQQHWLSDQVVGTIAGLTAGNVFYLLHFDDTGAPRRENRDADDGDDVISDSTVMPVLMQDGQVGAGWGFRW
ncbi:phosphatase PAP2 family protein [Persicimonas caeni]|uniref:Phosphatase PAP2 family protein n=1 Tax=Persicimonas caeni TaxID=2292766 RepID=A0A4Y6PR16_PERCE|nr:phosphatase PAP2 family protein [Persicimonas caeni]QDG50457.1 phosphatase PAP2 family protein [Persicimonas caeni]QED31678.1 phosphatase PAP2 family protein [Persicimonas caeni]